MIELNGYHYTECGLDYIWLENGVFELDGPYGKSTSIADLDELHKTIGLSILKTKEVLKGTEIRFLRHELDMSQNMLSKLLGSTEQTFSRWERGESNISGPAQQLLTVLYMESVNGEGVVRDILDEISNIDAELYDQKLTLQRCEEKWRPAA